jgi:hypothetical protein
MTTSDDANREPAKLTRKGASEAPAARTKATAGAGIVTRKRVFTMALMGNTGTAPPPDPNYPE